MKLTQTEISHLDMTLSVNKYVFRLEISVYNAVLVKNFESDHNFSGIKSNLLFSETNTQSSLHPQVSEKFPSRQIVHNKVKFIFCLECVVHVYDEW